MPNGQAQQQQQPTISPTVEKGWDIFWNRFNRILGPVNIFRYRTLKGQAAPIKLLLPQQIIDWNENLIDFLTKIETAWNTMDEYLWVSPPKTPKILDVYEKLGHYDDPAIVELEAEKFRTGGEWDLTIPGRYELRPINVKWSDGNEEELYIFGVAKIAELIERWRNLEEVLDQRAIAAGMDAGNRRFATNLRSGVARMLEEIQKGENEFLSNLLVKKGLHDSLATMRKEFLELTEAYNRYIRFRHTYKVIKPFFWDETNRRSVYFDSNKNRLLYKDPIVNHQPLPNQGIYRYTSFRPWPWEQHTGFDNENITITVGGRTQTIPLNIWTGLDENGYPLEIDDNGVVLLDRWWYEIGENPWQRQVIAAKSGGAEIIRRIDHIRANGIRVVDKRFVTDQAYLDLLEMAVYIYNEVDSVRDDTRDARYHPHSKTTTDYIIHSEGGLTIDVNKLKIPREILKKPIGLRFNPFSTNDRYGYIQAMPEYFNENIPAEEIAVKRNYQIMETDSVTFQFGRGPVRERTPTNISPAFDRRAMNCGVPLIHWGRMYYYEDTEGINKWSENPYPRISSRGVAKYIMYWIAVRTQNLSEAGEAAESEKGYDIGVRIPLVGGKFIKNPFREIISQ